MDSSKDKKRKGLISRLLKGEGLFSGEYSDSDKSDDEYIEEIKNIGFEDSKKLKENK